VHDTIYGLISSYGYLIVFLLVGIESLGIPLPGETALITAAAFAAIGRLEIFGVIGAAASGAILGDNAGYWIGKKGGLALIHKYGRYLHLDNAKIARMNAFFEKYGAKTVFIGRFVSLLRSWAAALAGVAGMPWGTFMMYNALGGIAWAGIFGTLGYVFGKNLPRLEHYIGQASMAAALLAALVVGVALLARWFSANRAKVSARMSDRWQHAAEDPRFAEFSSHHRRLWAYVSSRFARGEYLGLHLAAGFVLSVGVLWLFAEITEDVIHHDPLTRFDLGLASWMQQHESPFAHSLFHMLSLAGSPLVIAVIAAIVASVLAVKREWIILSGWLLAFFGGGLLGRFLQALVVRPRTVGGRELLSGAPLTLPTGHALGSLVGYGLLAYLLVAFIIKRRTVATAVVVAAGTLVAAIGFSRLYLGALYFSDIIGMYSAGVVWLTTCITGIEIARTFRNRPATG
jgi:membrane protein DedA with SNARE-associated domain/membrane-associated phospholipid phosphatase